MPAQQYRYIGETPVAIPDLQWGDVDEPVMPGDISPPYEGEVVSEVLVAVGSPEEVVWLQNRKATAKPAEEKL
jgi:hypothetical protein